MFKWSYYQSSLKPSASLWGQCCLWSVKQFAFSLPCQKPGRAFRQGVWRSRTTAQEGNHYLTGTQGWHLMVLATGPAKSFACWLQTISTRILKKGNLRYMQTWVQQMQIFWRPKVHKVILKTKWNYFKSNFDNINSLHVVLWKNKQKYCRLTFQHKREAIYLIKISRGVTVHIARSCCVCVAQLNRVVLNVTLKNNNWITTIVTKRCAERARLRLQ